jgi:hypothetical protein
MGWKVDLEAYFVAMIFSNPSSFSSNLQIPLVFDLSSVDLKVSNTALTERRYSLNTGLSVSPIVGV